MKERVKIIGFGIVVLAIISASGCALKKPSQESVGNKVSPPDVRSEEPFDTNDYLDEALEDLNIIE